MQLTKQQIISARLLALVASGMTIDQALDSMMGAGTYAKLASDVYHALRAKAGAA